MEPNDQNVDHAWDEVADFVRSGLDALLAVTSGGERARSPWSAKEWVEMDRGRFRVQFAETGLWIVVSERQPVTIRFAHHLKTISLPGTAVPAYARRVLTQIEETSAEIRRDAGGELWIVSAVKSANLIRGAFLDELTGFVAVVAHCSPRLRWWHEDLGRPVIQFA